MTRPDPTNLRTLYRHLARDWPAIETGTYIGDSYGRLAFRAQHIPNDSPEYGKGPLLCSYKDGLHDGQASFMLKPIRVAKAEKRRLIQFLSLPPTAGTAFVFHPELIDNQGKTASVVSPKGARVEVKQLSAQTHGVRLGDWLSGREPLPRPIKRENVSLSGWAEG